MPAVPMNPRVSISPPVIDLVFQSINRRAALPLSTPLKQLFPPTARGVMQRSAYLNNTIVALFNSAGFVAILPFKPNRTHRLYARASQTHPVKLGQRSV